MLLYAEHSQIEIEATHLSSVLSLNRAQLAGLEWRQRNSASWHLAYCQMILDFVRLNQWWRLRMIGRVIWPWQSSYRSLFHLVQTLCWSPLIVRPFSFLFSGPNWFIYNSLHADLGPKRDKTLSADCKLFPKSLFEGMKTSFTLPGDAIEVAK